MSKKQSAMQKRYGKEDLVSFGNYLLSKERERNVKPSFRYRVTHSDIMVFNERIFERKSGRQKKPRVDEHKKLDSQFTLD